MPSTRRGVLAVAGSLLAAGCIGTDSGGPGSSPTTDDPPPSTTRNTDQRTDDGESPDDECTAGIDVRTAPFAPVEDLPVPLDENERDLVAEAATEGAAERLSYGALPLGEDLFVRHEDVFYLTSFAVVDTEAVPTFLLDARWDADQETPDDAEVVAFADLPAVDRDALRTTILGPEREGFPQQHLSVSDFPAPYPGGGDGSRLIGETTWVRWRDHTVRVEVAGESESTRERRTVRYTLEQVATSPAAFRRYVAENYVVDLDDLPTAQARIVESARDGGYEECQPESGALAGLRQRLEDAGFPQDAYDWWYVRFADERFQLGISRWVH